MEWSLSTLPELAQVGLAVAVALFVLGFPTFIFGSMANKKDIKGLGETFMSLAAVIALTVLMATVKI